MKRPRLPPKRCQPGQADESSVHTKRACWSFHSSVQWRSRKTSGLKAGVATVNSDR